MTIDGGLANKIAISMGRKTLAVITKKAFRESFAEDIIKDIDFETIIEEKCKDENFDFPSDLAIYFEKDIKNGDLLPITKELVEKLYSYTPEKKKTIDELRTEFTTDIKNVIGIHNNKSSQFAVILFDVIDKGCTKLLQRNITPEGRLNIRIQHETLDAINKTVSQYTSENTQLTPPENLESNVETYLKSILEEEIFDIAEIYTEISILKKGVRLIRTSA